MEMPEIQHYCTMRESDFTPTDAGLFCGRCRKTLVNLDDPDAVATARKNGVLSCGFVRRLAVPALASSLGLSSCANHKAASSTMMAGTPLPIRSSEVSGKPDDLHGQGGRFLVGHIAPSPGDDSPESIPIAARVEGEPGMVISPYTGRKVDAGNVPPGKKAIDPTTGKEKKIFRMPKKEEPSPEHKDGKE